MMSEHSDSFATKVLGKRYLRIFRETIRRGLESELAKHLENDRNFNYYLSELRLDSSLSDEPNGFWERAKKAVERCDPIEKWFNLEKFWEDQENIYGSEPSNATFPKIIRCLLVRLHGFWIFTLDDTNHTFRFVSAAAKYDEWGPEPNTSGRANDTELIGPPKWPEPSIHFGHGVFYRRGITKGSEDLKEILKSSLEQYLLRPGEGSVGLGLRADRGVCLRDTVRDLRGAVALEDCIMRNLSYIGLPIFPKEADKKAESKLGDRGRPIGHFGIFFPAPLGWHVTLEASDWCKNCMFPCGPDAQENICLFQRALNLRRDIVQPLVAQNYVLLSDDRLKSQIAQIALLGNNPKFQNRGIDPSERRKVFLRQVIRDIQPGEKYTEKSGKKDAALVIEDFQAVQIWERHAAIAGLSEGAISASETATTWRQSVRWKFPDLFFAVLRQRLTDFSLQDGPKSGPWSQPPHTGQKRKDGPWQALYRAGHFRLDSEPLDEKHRILIVQKSPGSAPLASSKFLDNALVFWNKALDLIEKCDAPPSLPEFQSEAVVETDSDSQKLTKQLDKCIRNIKWQRLLRNHAAQCLASRLLPKRAEADSTTKLSTFLFYSATDHKALTLLLDAVPPMPESLAVSILGGADLRLDRTSIDVGNALEKIRPRLEHELFEVSHTLPVFLSLAQAAHEAGLLTTGAPLFLANHEPTSKESHDWPIQSEAYHDQSSEHHVDCGTETAFSIPSIWKAWCDECGRAGGKADPALAASACLDHIRLQKEDARGIRVSISSSKAIERDTTLSFLLVDNTEPCVDFHRVLAHDVNLLREHLEESSVRGCQLDHTTSDILAWRKAPKPCDAASSVLDFIERCRLSNGRPSGESKSSDSSPSFCVLLAYVGGEHRLRKRLLTPVANSQEEESDPCSEAKKEDIEPFVQIASSSHEDNLPLGSNFGLTTHIFVPISRPSEHTSTERTEEDIGFAVFSGSQVEHDTVRRVEIRPAQQALVSFATDYLEYAISQELQQTQQRAALQRVAHSISQDGDFYNSIDAMAIRYLRLLKWQQNTNDLTPFVERINIEKGTTEEGISLRALLSSADFLPQAPRQLFIFSAIVLALKQCLAGQPESARPPVSTIPTEATSLKTWIQFLTERIARAELNRDRPTVLEFDVRLDDAERETQIPFGSLCIVLDEMARNCGKYREDETRPKITLDYDMARRVFRVASRNRITGKRVSESTGGGLPILRSIVAANFGKASIVKSCRSPLDANLWELDLILNFASYEEIIKRSQEHSV